MTDLGKACDDLKREVERALNLPRIVDRLALFLNRHPRLSAALDRLPVAPRWMGVMFWIYACLAVQAAGYIIAWATGRLT